MSILRKKNHKVAHSNFGPSRLSNDIQSLIDDFHKDSDTFVNDVRQKIAEKPLVRLKV